MHVQPQLCLHVGYGKTGSSFLQNWLAQHRGLLAVDGIHYPHPEKDLGDSGNGALLLEALIQPHREPPWLDQLRDAKVILFSREQFARELSVSNVRAKLSAWCQRWGLAPIRVLMFVRDPRDHCYSLWAQKVKRAGERRSLHDFAASYDAISMARRMLLGAHDAGMQMTVRDYGQWKESLVPVLLRRLGVDQVDRRWEHLAGAAATAALINVTPSYPQLCLQRCINKWRQGRRSAGVPPPAWLALLLLQWRRAPRSYSPELLARWKMEVADFNSALSSVDADHLGPLYMPMLTPEG